MNPRCGESQARELDLPPKAVAKGRLSAVEQFSSIPRTGVIARLGLDQCRPIVQWLPTYRMARPPHKRTWCDAADLSSGAAVGQFIEAISAAAEDLHITVRILKLMRPR